MCRQAQLQAENGGCQCGGAALPPLATTFSDINGACNLCAGQSNAVVPISNYNEVVQTNVVGSMNCKGLYDAMIDGIISANLCPTVQQAAGKTCCNSSGGGNGNGGGNGGGGNSQTSSQIASQFTPGNNNISYNNGSPPAPAPAPVPAPGPWVYPVDPLPAANVPAPAPAPTPLYALTARPSSSLPWRQGRSSISSEKRDSRERVSSSIRGAAESPSF